MKYTLGLVAALLWATGALADENKVIELAKFKNVCLKAKGSLAFENGQWSCTVKPTTNGLEPLVISFPKN